MKCSECGFEYDDSLNFCPGCGVKNPSEVGHADTPIEQTQSPQKKPFWSKWKIAVAVGLAVLLVTGAIVGTIVAFSGGSGASSLSWNTQFDKVGSMEMSLYDVYAQDANHVWAVGSGDLVLFYDGKSWQKGSSDSGATLYGVHGLDSNHVWAVGYVNNGSSGLSKGIILFWDGKKWSQEETIEDSRIVDVFALDQEHVWAVGYSEEEASDSIFPKSTGAVVMFYDGEEWKQVIINTDKTLSSITACDPTHVWACGQKGIVMFYDGKSWEEQQTSVSGNLSSITAVDAKHVWACGFNGQGNAGDGQIIRFDGEHWIPDFSNAEASSWDGIIALDQNHLRAVGAKGAILYFDGQTWAEESSGTSAFFDGISAFDGTHAWAVGSVTGGIIIYGEAK